MTLVMVVTAVRSLSSWAGVMTRRMLSPTCVVTNPLMATAYDENGNHHSVSGGALTSIGQAEPNGIFASTNTSATWVMCVGDGGIISPVYVEAKVTVYPYPINVDYDTNRVTRAGKATVSITVGKR